MEDFRRKPVQEGVIGSDTLLHIIRAFRDEGFVGMTITGGEPLLNPDWDLIANEAARIGMLRVELTTNGTMLSNYLGTNGRLPDSLTLVKVSLDTFSPSRFREITRGGDIRSVMDAVRCVSLRTKTRANRVLLRSDMEDLPRYLESCKEIGFHEVNLLDLVAYPNRNDPHEITYFEREYIPFPEVRDYLYAQCGLEFNIPNRYGHQASFQGSMQVIMKDSRYTMRDDKCENCPVYCQEGKYTIRIGSDGNMTTCPDYHGDLPSTNGPVELTQGNLPRRVHELAQALESSIETYTIREFFRRHQIRLASRRGTPLNSHK